MSILEFVTESLTNKSNKQTKFIISTSISTDIIRLTRLNLEDYTHILDNFGIIHTFKKHGNAKKEMLRGQLAIEIVDFQHIETIVLEYDDIIYGQMNDMGNKLMKFVKAIERINYFYVVEIRTGRKEIALQTFYKRNSK
jgi:phage-Barnase-EndoU-ColicinE5/D-RelE like nuclease3